MTRSDLEDLFLTICRRHGFPRPRVNHDALHLTLGYRTVRLTDRQLESDEHHVAATLRAALAKARAA